MDIYLNVDNIQDITISKLAINIQHLVPAMCHILWITRGLMAAPNATADVICFCCWPVTWESERETDIYFFFSSNNKIKVVEIYFYYLSDGKRTVKFLPCAVCDNDDDTMWWSTQFFCFSFEIFFIMCVAYGILSGMNKPEAKWMYTTMYFYHRPTENNNVKLPT